MSEDDLLPRKHRARNIAAILASTAVVIVGIGIIVRKPLATQVIEAKLAAAHVPYQFRITTLSPFAQTIEGLRLGDPAHPDLIAQRIVLGWRYRLGWPELSAIRVEGARLSAKWDKGHLSLGSLDKFLPHTGNGGPALPKLNATIADSELALLTPAGLVRARIAGEGNLADGFRGRMGLVAPALAVGGCAIEGLRVEGAIGSEAYSPLLKGPMAIDRAICPTRGILLGAGQMAVDAKLLPDLTGASGQIQPLGFAGRAGGVAFGALGGTLSGRIDAKGGDGAADLTLAGVATAGAHAGATRVNGTWKLGKAGPSYEGGVRIANLVAPAAWASRAAAIPAATVGTPVGPIADRIAGLFADLARRSDVEGDIAYGAGGLHVDGLTLKGRRGAITIAGSYGSDARGGWKAEGELAELSSILPPISIHAESHHGLTARVEAATLEADGARLAFAPITLAGGRFATAVTIDGPLASGRIEGLHMPISGRYGAGGVRVGEGCAPVSFQSVTLASLHLNPASFSLCGAPLYANGRVRAEARDVHLSGESGAAPLTLSTATIGWADGRLHGAKIAARLGAGDDPTQLTIADVEGAIGTKGFGGRFLDADGSIGHVPLALSGASGDWRFGEGALHLSGALTVSDRAESARFKPMASSDVALSLVDGRIIGTGTLTPLGRKELVAKVTLHHNLGTGVGDAVLDVPGVTFAKKRLQPEMLTPLTLGVVANADGMVAGRGRIDWSPKATTSSGDFHTDALDFAAAFGPVTGVATNIHFTDLLGFVSAPHQEARIASVNPGVVVADGVAHFALLPGNRVAVEEAHWPFAGGRLTLEPSLLDFSHPTERHLTFTLTKLDAATFIQQLDFPNIAATGTFNGTLPMIFDADGGRIAGGSLVAQGPGTLAYVGELSNAQIGAMGKMAFDALKAIRYNALTISLDGRLDGEIISKVQFEGVRQATATKSIVSRALHKLPFKFNIQIRAPFRSLVGTARSYSEPSLLLQNVQGLQTKPAIQAAPVQIGATPPVR